MEKEIKEQLELLQKNENIDILLAAESGSRAWGCPSPDSDYDVRIIFKRKKSDYLKIDDLPDSINYFHGKLLDINGWDLKKTFKLIRKSNATPFEWCQSPIVYYEKEGFREKILDLCSYYFQAKHSVNHYKGIAKNSFFGNDLKGEIKLKKLFYVLRPLMAAKWIILKNEIPPMDIPSLIKIIPNKEIVDHIEKLLEIKATANESYVHQIDTVISEFIEKEFNWLNGMSIEKRKDIPSSDKLNQTFLEIIEE